MNFSTLLLLCQNKNHAENESIHFWQIGQFTGKTTPYPLLSSPWQAHAADPAHPAIKTRSDTA